MEILVNIGGEIFGKETYIILKAHSKLGHRPLYKIIGYEVLDECALSTLFSFC